MRSEEGVIKFTLDWTPGPPPDAGILSELIAFRDVLHRKYMIAADDEGVGFGNISIRTPEGFVISGTQTGHLTGTLRNDYTWVSDWDVGENRVTCIGPVKASSETMTHAAVYDARPEVRGVIHVHHPALWEKVLYRIPTTLPEVPYGTTAMAEAVADLARAVAPGVPGILAMAGHDAGLLSYGPTLESALTILLETKARARI